MLLCGNYTMTYGRYIKRRNMSGRCLFLSLKGSNSHLKYDFLTAGGLIYLPIKYLFIRACLCFRVQAAILAGFPQNIASRTRNKGRYITNTGSKVTNSLD